MRSQKPNPIIILISLILSVATFTTFMFWWSDIVETADSLSFRFTIFVWTLVITICFLALVRAAREWWP